MSSNPFATHYVSPGKLPWLDAQGHTLQSALEALRRRRFRGAIVGPHGSGKSTLLEHLVPTLGRVVFRSEPASPHTRSARTPPLHRSAPSFAIRCPDPADHRIIVWLRLRRSQRSLATILGCRPYRSQHCMLVLDGFEQIAFPARAIVALTTAVRGMGLIVTTHRAPWVIPIVVRTSVTPELAQRLVRATFASAEILPTSTASRDLSELCRLKQLLRTHAGSMREVFMQLYDQFEDHRFREWRFPARGSSAVESSSLRGRAVQEAKSSPVMPSALKINGSLPF